MVFAVGPLTPAVAAAAAGGGGGEDEEAALSPVLAGETPPAVPLYFFEAGGSESLSAKLEEDSCEYLVSMVRPLGRFRVPVPVRVAHVCV